MFTATPSQLSAPPRFEGLELTEGIYRKLTYYGVLTVEQLVDARTRGQEFTLNVKQLGRIDATLLERGLLPAGYIEREAS